MQVVVKQKKKPSLSLSAGSWLCTLMAILSRLLTAKPGATAKAKAAAVLRRKDRCLFRRLSDLGGASGKVGSTIDQYVSEGRPPPLVTVLHNCIRDLSRFKRFHLALEIMEWMELRKYEFKARDYGVRLNLIVQVNGMAAAESYFNSLSPTAGAFNHLMSLYMKSGHLEKVLVLAKEMEERKIQPDRVTYNIMMITYARLNDIMGVERVFEEKKRYDLQSCNWISYRTLASIYIKAGSTYHDKAKLALENVEKEMDSQDPKAYRSLITLYASLSDLDQVRRIWKLLKSNVSPKKSDSTSSYLIMVQALGSLGEIEEMTKFYKEWESECSSYDIRLVNAAIRAYLKHNMVEEAEKVLEVTMSRSTKPFFSALEKFMNFYLDKNEIKLALKMMEMATSNDHKSKWQPGFVVDKFLAYFKKEGDAERAKEFHKMMKGINCVDSRVNEALLEVYKAPRRT